MLRLRHVRVSNNLSDLMLFTVGAARDLSSLAVIRYFASQKGEKRFFLAG